MFKFIKSRLLNTAPEVVIETQRQTIERALSEVNEVLALMSDKPKVTIDPATGSVTLDLPEHMPDEALALPAPAQEEPSDAEAQAETDEDKKDTVKEDVVG